MRNYNYFNYHSRDEERRHLRIRLEQMIRAAASHKKKREEAEEATKVWQHRYQEMEKENEQLKKEIEEIKRQRDTYKNMLFKKNVDHPSLTDSPLLEEVIPQRQRGGQIGHQGYGRVRPATVTDRKRVFLKVCPSCLGKLHRAGSVVTHTVEDIPTPETVKTIVTRYQVERQWCSSCHQEVTACPVAVIPGSRLGINLLVEIMVLKYGARIPLASIVFLLHHQYGITVSVGGIVNSLHRAKIWLGPAYEKIKQKIRASPIIHADETGWRIEGINSWVWAFLSNDAVCYRVEESRGKGIPQEFLKDGNPHSVLVRDDYAAYHNLPLTQQSCWAHLLRKSHEAVKEKTVSVEMKKLHQLLKSVYERLSQAVNQPFNKTERKIIHTGLSNEIERIIAANFKHDDTIGIQKRVKHQNQNLLTALLYPNVPLTNNHAERNIRPLVVIRKISGGSRSANGAQTHMVNMSIFQTIKLQNQPLIPTLKQQLLNGVFGKN